MHCEYAGSGAAPGRCPRRVRRQPIGLCLAAIAASLIASAASFAERVDVVTLSTGESLTVEILSIDDELVTFRHPSLGTMTVPRSAVATVVRDVERTVAPAAGETIAEATSTDEAVAGATAGADAAASAAPDSSADPGSGAAAAPADEPDPKPWKFKLTFAGGGASGNTENINFVFRFLAVRETEETRFEYDAAYFYGSTDGDKTDNRITTGVRHDWLLPGSRWFLFARGRYDYDEFQSWLHRVQGFGGVGYELIQPPKFKLNALAGLGVVKEWKSNNEDPRLEGLFGLEGTYDIAEDHQFVFATTIYPDLTDLGEFRWVNSAGWSWRFNSNSPMALTAGLAHEYQSAVDPGRDRNDVRVFAGVDWDF